MNLVSEGELVFRLLPMCFWKADWQGSRREAVNPVRADTSHMLEQSGHDWAGWLWCITSTARKPHLLCTGSQYPQSMLSRIQLHNYYELYQQIKRQTLQIIVKTL